MVGGADFIDLEDSGDNKAVIGDIIIVCAQVRGRDAGACTGSIVGAGIGSVLFSLLLPASLSTRRSISPSITSTRWRWSRESLIMLLLLLLCWHFPFYLPHHRWSAAKVFLASLLWSCFRCFSYSGPFRFSFAHRLFSLLDSCLLLLCQVFDTASVSDSAILHHHRWFFHQWQPWW